MILREERIAGQRLLLGDSLAILPTLGRFDLLLTDPPYGIGADKRNAQSSIRDNPKWGDKGWDQARPCDASFGAMLNAARQAIIWGGNYFADMLPPSSGWLSWRKPEAETGFSLADIELAWTNLQIAARQKTLPRRDGNIHPTQKPVALMDWCLGFAPNARTVIDPYLGSGTTLVSCVRKGLAGTGIERDPGYFADACRRVDEASRQPDLFVAPAPAAPTQEVLL
jgi:DNA modification methylase